MERKYTTPYELKTDYGLQLDKEKNKIWEG